ncbi:MAG: putative manganese transporter [Eubacteriales bacterium]|nr:putative manganese transporter [Eubacteriales bacterium]
MIDQIFQIAFSSASVAIFEVGSIMAVLMLLFGVLDYKKGDQLRLQIEQKKLDQPILMAVLALIPIDGTLLFQYNIYRRKSIRSGSLLGGIIGIGEEATYLILSFNPLSWLMIAGIKLITALGLGTLFNRFKFFQQKSHQWLTSDLADGENPDAVQADENFHALPDRFRHQLHHFRYHKLGKAFWIFFAGAFILHQTLHLLERFDVVAASRLQPLSIPFTSWIAMVALFFVLIYHLVVRTTTREFGKIFEHEFEDTGDAVGDLAEGCAQIILYIFLVSFLVQVLIASIGTDSLLSFFALNPSLTIIIGALVGLIPGTGGSLAFTTLYFSLSVTGSAMPFAALVACSIALIGDSQFVGQRQIKRTQRVLHLIAFAAALVIGFLIWTIERAVTA